jgi:CubicO group peptidase (beta-lactamase class C family)
MLRRINLQSRSLIVRGSRSSHCTLIAMALCIVSACARGGASEGRGEAGDAARTLGPRPLAEAVVSAVDSLAARIVAEGLTPALGVALVMDGRTVFSKAYGMTDITNNVPADESTLWYLASTSKSFTGFGVSLLAHQGVIAFDAPITTLLPHAQWPSGVDARKLELTHFLSHTHRLNDVAITQSASFTGEFPESQWPAMIRYAARMPRDDLVYSNFGYNVAAMVIDAKRPEGWRRYLDSAVYRPAGMTETYTRVSGLDPRRIAMPHTLLRDGRYVTIPFHKTDATMNSAGGHLATLRDLARWVTVQMDSGVIDGERVFPAEAVALSHRRIARQTLNASKRFAFFDREGWGAGWDIGSYRGEPMVSRFGAYSSTRSHLSFLPGRRVGVVAQTNGTLGYQATDIVAAFAYDLERGDPNARAVAEERLQELLARRATVLAGIATSDSTRASRQQPLQRPLSDFAGSYRHEWYGTVTFEVRDNRVHYEWGVLQGAAEVFDATRNILRIEVVGTGNTVAFNFPRPGPASALELRGVTFLRVE